MPRSSVIALVIAGWCAPAFADSTAILVTGDPTARERELATTTIAATLRAHGGEPITAPFTESERTSLIHCFGQPRPWTCMMPVVLRKADHLLLVDLTHSRARNGATTVVVSVQISVPSLDSVIGDSQTCEQCTDDLLVRLVEDMTRDQVREAAVRIGRTVVTVTSVPTGARISFDGKSFGATNASIRTYPGPHQIRLELDGYKTEERSVDAIDGKTTEVSATLKPDGAQVPATPAPDPSSPTSRYLVPGIVGGVGVLALAGGLVLQAIKEGPPVGEDQPARLYSGPGIGLAIGGGLAIGVAVFLWRRAGTSAPAASAAMPAITIGDGGGGVAWTGRF